MLIIFRSWRQYMGVCCKKNKKIQLTNIQTCKLKQTESGTSHSVLGRGQHPLEGPSRSAKAKHLKHSCPLWPARPGWKPTLRKQQEDGGRTSLDDIVALYYDCVNGDTCRSGVRGGPECKECHSAPGAQDGFSF